MLELRIAYFRKAKECHPDVRSPADQASPHQDFLEVTMAYEKLQQEVTGLETDAIEMSFTEEQSFRIACEQQLGLPAEIVEECKTSPMFREWLSGNTDSAHHWRNFFMQHGGLAPILQTGCAKAIQAGPVSGAASRRKRR